LVVAQSGGEHRNFLLDLLQLARFADVHCRKNGVLSSSADRRSSGGESRGANHLRTEV
jgi:hypothetical protein